MNNLKTTKGLGSDGWTLPRNRLQFRTDDSRFGVELNTSLLDRLLRWSQAAAPNETGGILIGRYNEAFDLAIVERVMNRTRDSRSGQQWFYRGTKGLQQRLVQLWQEQRWYYLGEWHSHPGALPIPSKQDDLELSNIAIAPEEACPEPILFILGRSLTDGNDCAAYVYAKGRRLKLINLEPEAVE